MLFPIQHGVLYYPGFDVLPPFVVHRTSRVDATWLDEIRAAWEERLDHLQDTTPIAFRPQNAGDCEIPALTLRADVVPGRTGFAAHVR